MNEDYELSPAQIEWGRKKKQGLSPSYLKELIKNRKDGVLFLVQR